MLRFPLHPHLMRVHTLDLHFQNTPGLIAAYLVECGQELALVETGPGSTLPALCEGVTALGYDIQKIRHVFVTHIHLDHAGAAGWWARQGARVYCHPSAARHLMDPSRLIDSARRVYGEAMDTLWGEMLPAPEDQVTALQDGESVSVGQHQITAWDTPGHARHHHAFVLGDACFTGDVAGLRLNGSPYLSVTSAPPQFDPPAYSDSVDRLRAAGFQRLYLTHFGEVTDVNFHLSEYRRRIEEVHQNMRSWLAQGCSAEDADRRYHEYEHTLAMQTGLAETDWQRYQQANSTTMCAAGVRLFVEKCG